MKLKKILAGVWALFLCSALLLPVSVQAMDQSEGATTITTRVPDTHTVLLEIGEHGSVLIGNKIYTAKDKRVEVARLTEQTYTIQTDKGWQVEQVKYGQKGALEAVKLTDNAFTAPAVNSDDNKLTVTFKKGSAGGGTDKPTTPDKEKNTGIQTGSSAELFLPATLLIFSVPAGFVLMMKKRKEADAAILDAEKDDLR